MVNTERPYLMMIGGVKLSEKLAAMSGILNHCDSVIVGCGIATLFYLAQGYEVGKSLAEKSKIVEAKDILRNYKSKIHLPVDVVVARSPEEEKSIRVTKPDEVSPEEMILDIGPETIKKYSEIIREAKTVLWSGPMGLFENKHFAHGTKALGRLFASRSQGLSFGIAGGGDTLAAIKMLGVGEDIDHLSTGGSSMLQYLSGIMREQGRESLNGNLVGVIDGRKGIVYIDFAKRRKFTREFFGIFFFFRIKPNIFKHRDITGIQIL